MAEIIRGSIFVISKQHKNSADVDTLPSKFSAEELSEQADNVGVPSGLRILAVDDIALNLDLLTTMLSHMGHAVDTATNGKFALQKMQSNSYDLIIMDLQMPVMDGMSAAAQRRRWEDLYGQPHVPMIALTGSVFLKDKYDAIAAGMEGFTNKPIEFSALKAEIARVMAITDESSTEATYDRKREIIDKVRGTLLWGDEALLYKEIQLFVDTMNTRLSELVSSLVSGDYDHVAGELSNLKGKSGNLGLMKLMTLLSSFEDKAKSKRLFAEDIPTLKTAVREVVLSMQQTRQNKKLVTSETVDSAALLKILDNVLKAAENHCIDSHFTETVKAHSFGKYHVYMVEIVKDMAIFEFENAQSKIIALKAEISYATEIDKLRQG